MRLEEELKMNRFKSPHQKVALNILFTSNWLNDKMASLIKDFDISEQQFNVLRILRGQNGKAINLMDIQERMLHKTSNTTRLVEKLRLKNLVERVLCEENRRKVEISITKEGLKLLTKIDPIITNKNDEIYSVLSHKEALQLSNLLDKLRN